MNWKKAIPWIVVGFVALLVMTLVVVNTYLNSDPELIQAKASFAEKSAVEWQSKQTYFQNLPQILMSGAWSLMMTFLGGAVLIFGISASVSIMLGSTSRFLHNGIGYYKKQPGNQETRVYLATPNRATAAGRGEYYDDPDALSSGNHNSPAGLPRPNGRRPAVVVEPPAEQRPSSSTSPRILGRSPARQVDGSGGMDDAETREEPEPAIRTAGVPTAGREARAGRSGSHTL